LICWFGRQSFPVAGEPAFGSVRFCLQMIQALSEAAQAPPIFELDAKRLLVRGSRTKTPP
jgi:hypothetical protein